MQNVKELIKDVRENISLAQYTTFKIGGAARYFFIAKNAEDVKDAVKAAHDTDTPIYIFGNGSKLLVSDEGFNGLVIKIQNMDIKIDGEVITCAAGVNVFQVVQRSVNAGLTGLEFLTGIPATVGGAVCGNAGAFGSSIANVVEKVEAADYNTGEVKWMSNKECQFGYRDSIFKREKYVIINAVVGCKTGNTEESKKKIAEILALRNQKHPLGHPNIGSIFKNVLIKGNEALFEKLAKSYGEIESFRSKGSIPAGWFIEECGLKGKEVGGAKISEKHANFIINFNHAKARDVMILVSMIKEKVRVKFGIQLVEEMRYVGF